jgi:hypothetical protein
MTDEISDNVKKQLQKSNHALTQVFESLEETQLIRHSITGQPLILDERMMSLGVKGANRPISLNDIPVRPEQVLDGTNASKRGYPAAKDFEKKLEDLGLQVTFTTATDPKTSAKRLTLELRTHEGLYDVSRYGFWKDEP